jgi:hypothetical protein
MPDLPAEAPDGGEDNYPDSRCYCGGCIGMGPCDDEGEDDAEWPPGVVTEYAFEERRLL